MNFSIISPKPPRLSAINSSTRSRSVTKRLGKPMLVTSKLNFLSLPKLKSQAHSKIWKKGLSVHKFQHLYQSKCKGLMIPVISDQEDRFLRHIYNNLKLRKLELQESALTNISSEAVSDILRSNNFFAYVNLSKNALRDPGISEITPALLSNNSIVALNISSNGISPKGSAKLFQALKSHSSLFDLNIGSNEGINKNRLGKSGAVALSALLKSNLVLGVLNISGTSLNADAIAYILEGLSQNSGLVSLNLANNDLGSSFVDKFAESVATSSLKSINLESNSLGNDGCERLGKLLYSKHPLEKLNLTNNGIGTNGAKRLFKALRKDSSILSLNLKSNNLAQGPSDAFLDFLIDNKYMQYLNLSDCGMESEGLHLFAEGLAQNSGLMTLKLNRNGIQDNGAIAIAMGLAKNKSLKTLDLSGNSIKNKAGISLAKALKSNPCIEKVFLRDNRIKDEAGQMFGEVSKARRNLLNVDLNLNPINIQLFNLIQDNIKSNLHDHLKNSIPRLKHDVKRLQIKEFETENLQIRIERTEKMYQDVKYKYNQDLKKLKQIEDVEKQRTQQMKLKLHKYMQSRQKYAKELNDYEVAFRQEKGSFEATVSKMRKQINQIELEIKSSEKMSNSYTENALLRKRRRNRGNPKYKEAFSLKDTLEKDKQNFDNAKDKLKEYSKTLIQRRLELEKYKC